MPEKWQIKHWMVCRNLVALVPRRDTNCCFHTSVQTKCCTLRGCFSVCSVRAHPYLWPRAGGEAVWGESGARQGRHTGLHGYVWAVQTPTCRPHTATIQIFDSKVEVKLHEPQHSWFFHLPCALWKPWVPENHDSQVTGWDFKAWHWRRRFSFIMTPLACFCADFSSWSDQARALRYERRLVGTGLPDLRNGRGTPSIQDQGRASPSVRHGEKDSDRAGGVQNFQQANERHLQPGEFWDAATEQLSLSPESSSYKWRKFLLLYISYWPRTLNRGWAAMTPKAKTYKPTLSSTASTSGCWRQDW